MQAAGVLQEIAFWRSRCDNLLGTSGSSWKSQRSIAQSGVLMLFFKELLLASTVGNVLPIYVGTVTHCCCIRLIRSIWINPCHTTTVIVGLFCKMSNEIIRHCSQSISLDKIFKGYVIFGKQSPSQRPPEMQPHSQIYKEQVAKLRDTGDSDTQAAGVGLWPDVPRLGGAGKEAWTDRDFKQHSNARTSVSRPIQTLVEPDESLKLWEYLQGDLAKTEAQIPLIHEQ
ncbi:putative dynein heavy chain 2 axonemal [Scophthalmus maximus]|uniref:Putative dynein heavy chain 2 axonemal n=1 Tax=Scophthalmus maximus TaxID=52904 RepID=A0A2U9BAL2_SCOMX|nr:putative dynein heavy chain 2 axonemal [Scophthalmus maximus]